VSVYAAWEPSLDGSDYAVSAHRILSDLSILTGLLDHRLLVARDWNILRGYDDEPSEYREARYETAFERAEALGLRC
jgi:hypothetical protein